MEKIELQARLFGSFEVMYNGRPLEFEGRRSGKAFVLLQYLFFRHDSGASRTELMDVICSNRIFENPAGILTNNIYRLKNILGESELPEGKYVVSRKGRYQFTPELCITTDVELFEAACGKARGTGNAEDYKNALSLYTGGFLPELMDEQVWVRHENSRLEKLFIQTALECCETLKQSGRTDEIPAVCTGTLAFYPESEELHVYKIEALYELKRYDAAIAAFEESKALLFELLNLPVASKLRELYTKLSGALKGKAASIKDVGLFLMEPEPERGVYYCNFLAFVDCFRYTMRVSTRFGQSVYLMLCELNVRDTQTDTLESRVAECAKILENAIVYRMRSSDLYTQYSKTQFLVMMQGITRADCDSVMQRITDNYDRAYKGRGIRAKCSVLPAAEKARPGAKYARKTQ